MEFSKIKELRDLADREGVMFFYNGYFSQKVLLAVGDTIKLKFQSEEEDRMTTKKVFSIFVEQVQNIIRYSDDTLTGEKEEDEMRAGMVVIGKEAARQRYYVSCANYVPDSAVERLKTKLEALQKMDREAIKKAYRQKMREEPDEESKGAGLGFLEIAKTASEPVEFLFQPQGEGKHLFLFKSYI